MNAHFTIDTMQDTMSLEDKDSEDEENGLSLFFGQLKKKILSNIST